MDKQQLETTVAKVLDEMRERPIPLGISNRHIHLCAEDYGRLFPITQLVRKKSCCSQGNMQQSRLSRWWGQKVS